MKNSLKKTLIVDALILVFAVVLFAYTSFAYFSDQKQISSTITTGNVAIVLSESAVKHDQTGNLVADPEKPRITGSADHTPHDYGTVYPGQSIYKDPTVLNTGTETAYIAAKVTITDGRGDIYNILGIDGYEDIELGMLAGGGLLSEFQHFGKWNGIEDVTYNDKFALIQVPHRAQGRYDFYFFILDPVSHGESVTFFDHLSFAPELTNAQMQEFIDLKIDIRAFGTQVFGFSSCYEAMTTALPEYFIEVTHSAP